MTKRKTSNRVKRSDLAGGTRKKREKSPSDMSNLVALPAGAKKEANRVGRGPGSGNGTTAGRGQKGQKARASSMRRGFEGGQMRLALRIPKRGFRNIFSVYFQPVNLGIIEKIGLTGEITPEILESKGLIKSSKEKVKVLGTGELKKSINIVADAFSKSAEEKIQKAGGTFTLRKVEKVAN
ncbi:MAG: 50S ribosomal protein L15 [Leptospiraceae bacterium]|nr:50S ribosomal protein L15 [Leptospiraceae bacterium]MCP5511879.1 50S ribosomal protein L15 [Leptospiraceae bacterium]